jgi:hypothetical protein
VVFGMHIMGSPVQDIADRMGMTPKGVRHSISIPEGSLQHPPQPLTSVTSPRNPTPSSITIASTPTTGTSRRCPRH